MVKNDNASAFEDRADAPSFRHYLGIARVDHWFKNLFVLPGFVAALLFVEEIEPLTAMARLAVGLAATCLIASANYTINEWLDAPFDRLHPTKKNRPAARGLIRGELVWLQWAVLAAAGLLLGSLIGPAFTICAGLLLFMGLVYNVAPVRSKDLPYLDVLSESINNPLRFMLGWTVVLDALLPPSSALIAYWMGGAFLMAIKRFSEYRFIGDHEAAGTYRRSFYSYSENSLLASAFFYALTSSFFLGIFLIKYRIEYLLLMPLLAFLFTGYLWIGLRPDSVAQRPEKLYSEKKYGLFILILCLAFVILTIADMPWLNVFLDPVAL